MITYIVKFLYLGDCKWLFFVFDLNSHVVCVLKKKQKLIFSILLTKIYETIIFFISEYTYNKINLNPNVLSIKQVVFIRRKYINED